ncbi:hypothetical protein SDRG_08741 [Saprolegnia diclina VS20]|uniref:PRA1 family protein n=1 Tax=Saprolegnia diclina (strain VS20) TaxID=1156394 RepID=T0RTJ9_SAPDV|nr:hypothetical protein SDRG_08741 [Saprolegnia diclina VS20]EQC33637.1 hypothetical protein SDRG_08741 [Saprolegnia diclina VS20]|eukprot:XP_008612860.1 hypothetical protein SDRG_08741 [Saprolegnia diclina VS20]
MSTTKKDETIAAPLAPMNSMAMMAAKMKDVMNLRNLRGVVSFFGLGEPKPFEVPAKEIALSRLRKNMLYFATNYMLVVACVGFLSILMNPFFLFILMCIAAGWYYVAQITANETEENPFKIGGRSVSASQRNVGMLAVTGVLVVYFGGSVLFSIFSVSTFLAIAHAFLRNSNIPEEEDDLGFDVAAEV